MGYCFQKNSWRFCVDLRGTRIWRTRPQWCRSQQVGHLSDPRLQTYHRWLFFELPERTWTNAYRVCDENLVDILFLTADYLFLLFVFICHVLTLLYSNIHKYYIWCIKCVHFLSVPGRHPSFCCSPRGFCLFFLLSQGFWGVLGQFFLITKYIV